MQSLVADLGVALTNFAALPVSVGGRNRSM
jgi:hypothetical protein